MKKHPKINLCFVASKFGLNPLMDDMENIPDYVNGTDFRVTKQPRTVCRLLFKMAQRTWLK